MQQAHPRRPQAAEPTDKKGDAAVAYPPLPSPRHTPPYIIIIIIIIIIFIIIFLCQVIDITVAYIILF